MLWSDLRRFGQIRLFRLAYVVTLGGPVVLLPEVQGKLLASPAAALDVFFLYLASTLLVLATLLYDLYCPEQIKRNADEPAHNRAKLRALNEFRSLSATQIETFTDLSDQSIKDLAELFKIPVDEGASNRGHSADPNEQRQRYERLFGRDWDDFEADYKAARWASGLSFLTSAILFFIFGFAAPLGQLAVVAFR